MAAGRRVHSLYDLATFTTVKNCDLFKLEYRSLPNAVQCDIYRTVCILILSSYFFFALLPRQLMFTKFVQLVTPCGFVVIQLFDSGKNEVLVSELSELDVVSKALKAGDTR